MIKLYYKTVSSFYISFKKIIFDLAPDNYSLKNIKIVSVVWLFNDYKIFEEISFAKNSIIAINSIVKNDIPMNYVASVNPAVIVN